MANATAWAEGAAIGKEAAQHSRDRKEMLSDEDRQQKANDLIETKHNTLANLPSIKGLYGEDSQQYKDALQTITQSQYNLGQLYDPIKNPNALQQDWHFLLEKLHGIKQPKGMKQPKESKKTSSPDSNAPETTPNTPAATGDAPAAAPADQQTTPASPAAPVTGAATNDMPIVQGKGVYSTDPTNPASAYYVPPAQGTPSTTSPNADTPPAAPPVEATKAPLSWKDRGQYQSPKELKQKAEAMQKAQQEAGLEAAGAGLSPGQVANALLQSKLQEIESDKELTPEDKAEARRKVFGIGEKPIFKPYKLPNGLIQYLDASRPDLIPEGATAVVGETTDTRKRADYKAFTDKTPDYEKNGGTFEKWLATERAQGTASVPKPKNKDDRYIDIEQRKALGQPLTADDQAFTTAYDLWTKKTKVDPGVARAAAFSAYRYIPVVDNSDPNNPGNVVLMQAAQAAKSGASTPASIGFKTDAAITRYMTSGQGGTNINYFNTATSHLALLRKAGLALRNGDTQLFNTLSNRWATATGNPAPTNFDTVKAAVAGELSKTFKGTGATDQEIGTINTTINQAESPDQINGAIDYYTNLMGGKIQALKDQYETAKKGKPNFPGTTNGNAPKSKGSRSLATAMALPVNKGKSAEEVEKHITDLGYTVTKP